MPVTEIGKACSGSESRLILECPAAALLLLPFIRDKNFLEHCQELQPWALAQEKVP